MENKIDFIIPEDVIASVSQKISEIQTELKPYLIALSPDERRELPKMSDKTQPFVEKALAYSASAPQFAPPYMDTAGLANDMKVHEQLTPLLREIRMIYDNLDDTTMEAGAESYVCTLTYYNSVKMAAKMDIPGAKSIYEDLRKRFEKNTPEKEEE
ncbi:hypothetical protein OU798_18435 [Prolixibacteraceae bacterium Z1-6]|uniref:Uncharacterized protein n=1 Tax=Draconibacterium aestuarii TaxID=2998507 RepID=A0A9X3FGM5_9BACT|nr:hypothetical protein [Prolixibacteraceae bacterium Z1-6]